MTMKWIGIDVRKDELAVCVMNHNKEVEHASFANNKKGYRSLVNYLKKRGALNWHDTRIRDPKRAERHWLVLAHALIYII